MTYEELKQFILEEMIMHEGYNYQPVMIKALNQNDGKATKDFIMKKLHESNPEHPESYFNNSPVFDVLTKKRSTSCKVQF